jgi:Family of unknown function (DUF6112)
MHHKPFAAGPNISPNTTGLPGTSEAEKIVGALLTYGLIAAVAGIAIAAITWALGTHSANPHLAGRGKTGVVVACVAALLVGGADILVNFFATAGSSLS